jgi:hypothetical protein
MQAEIPRAFLRTALAEYLAAPAADERSGAPLRTVEFRSAGRDRPQLKRDC